MKIIVFFLVFALYLSPARAQNDVCCITAKVSGDAVSTSALPKSASDCQVGGNVSAGGSEQKVCDAKEDPQNLCPTYEAEQRCAICGYFWNGKSCLTEDPVAKAKKQLEEEMKAKEELEKKGASKP